MMWCNDYSDLIIAVSTVFIAVLTGILAYYAFQQNEVATRALELNSRPYIEVLFDINSVQVNAGQKMMMQLRAMNFGGTPADVRAKGIIVYSSTKLASPTIGDRVDERRDTVFPKNPSPNMWFISSTDPITVGQANDMRAGTGFLYMRVLAKYGPYHTELCKEIPLEPTKDPVAIFAFNGQRTKDCDDSNSRNAN